MPTNRRKRTRNGADAIPRELVILFEIGGGWNQYSQKWLRRQWNTYGPAYLRSRKQGGQCMAEKILGLPQEVSYAHQ
jgi:hypothetical protein